MDWKEFACGISLSKEAVEQIEEVGMTEAQYEQMRGLYCLDHELFFQEECEKDKAAQRFLAFYSRMACDVYEKYKKEGIEEGIFWDTFQDLRFWSENYYQEHGSYGIGAYDWFWRHMDMTVFRLGRLQFEQMKMGYTVGKGEKTILQGTPVINIHIPQGEPMEWDACQRSFAEAGRRFGWEKPYVCHSWLLYPGLKQFLKPSSNILEFQKHFYILEEDFKEKEAEERLFGKQYQSIEEYPQQTSLQKAVKKYLLEGNQMGNGWGILIDWGE